MNKPSDQRKLTRWNQQQVDSSLGLVQDSNLITFKQEKLTLSVMQDLQSRYFYAITGTRGYTTV